MEIARGRDQSRRQELGQKARDEEHRRAQGQTQTRETAINEVQRWATERAAADIDYKAKEGKILAKLKTIAETYPPNLWLVRIKEAYADIGEIAPPAVTGNGKDNALRRGAGGGAGSPAPKTMQEAIAAGLGW